MTDTIIVGGGAAGLMAARTLGRAGRKVLVLEAGERLGGRIRTVYGTNAGIPIELGAEFIHGDAPQTTKRFEEARLATFPVLGAPRKKSSLRAQPKYLALRIAQ
ncbi:MAG: FAD-dependent oxidoreductase [Gemmatimonadales bacterium]